MMEFHSHHIVPIHAGGTNDPQNLLRVNVPLHAFLHKRLWEECGRTEDKLAWLMLSGKKPEAEAARRELVSERMKAKWSDPAFRAAQAERNANRWANPEHRKRVATSNSTRWDDPQFRQRMVQKMSDVANHEALSAGAKRMWEQRKRA